MSWEGDTGPEVIVQWAPKGFPQGSPWSFVLCQPSGEVEAGRGGTNVERVLGGEAGGHWPICFILEGLVQLWVHRTI